MANPSSPPLPAQLGRQPSLDGIRGLAILAVLILHLDWLWLPGGFLGVDIFFALSGFLITTLLLEEQFELGRISLGSFFARRGIRLYPALVALVLASTVLLPLLGYKPPESGRTGLIALEVLGYAANWATITETRGFGGMNHTWSLAIEAHFYVLWAVTLTLIARKFSAADQRAKLLKILTWVAAGFALGSAGWRAILWANDAPWLRMYLATDTRLDAVFVGALAAIIRIRLLSAPAAGWLVTSGRGMISVLETVCVIVLLLLLRLLEYYVPVLAMFPFTIAAVATAVLILTTTLRKDTLFGTVLRFPVLTWLGRISYSLYIWHFPVSRFLTAQRLMSHGIPRVPAEAVRVAACLIVATLSYHLIERTFLRLKNRFEPKLPRHRAVPAGA